MSRDESELQGWLDDVVDGVESAIDADDPIGDFAAVVTLAHSLDPECIPASAVAEVAAYAPIVDLERGRRLMDANRDPALQAVIDDARRHVEFGTVTAPYRSLGDEPTPSGHDETLPMVRAARGRPWVIAIAVASAALALLTLGASLGRTSVFSVVGRRAAMPVDQALAEQVETERAEQRAAVRVERTRRRVAPPHPPLVQEEPLVPPEIVADPIVPERPRRTPKRAPPPSLADTLATLDAEARAAWKAGDRETARQRFEAIVERGGHGRLADLAYGDLFTLARQDHHVSEELELWRAYLSQFPRGRFSDDARAGLCRRASAADKAVCWRQYLADMPGGSYRVQAERELGRRP